MSGGGISVSATMSGNERVYDPVGPSNFASRIARHTFSSACRHLQIGRADTRERIVHRVHNRGEGADGAGFAGALDAERISLGRDLVDGERAVGAGDGELAAWTFPNNEGKEKDQRERKSRKTKGRDTDTD